ncbi:nuclear transport factor 2 family protein [Spirillospora sp. NPDC052269]
MTDPRDLNPIFSERFNAGDAGPIADLYEKDAVFHTSTGPITGREAIRDHYATMLASSPTMDSRARRILSCGDDLALITSDWTFTVGSDSRSGVSVEVVRRQPDGTWMYVIDEPDIQR